MAEPPKPKRPSRSRKAPEPDFSPFEDWLIDGPAGEWPEPWESKIELSDKQWAIVSANAALLLNLDAWSAKVLAFETAITNLSNETRRNRMRACYQIRFDFFQFEDGQKNFSDYQFPCSVSFAGVDFGNGNVWFDNASFGPGDVFFSEAKFRNGVIWFVSTIFGDGNVWFTGTEFDVCRVNFSDAIFGDGLVMLVGLRLKYTTINANDMIVHGNLQVRSHFPLAIYLNAIEVRGVATFSGSTFEAVPDFRDAKFDRPPELTGMEVPHPRLALPRALTAASSFIRWYRGIENTDAEKQISDDGIDGGKAKRDGLNPVLRWCSWRSRTASAVTEGVRQVSTSIFYMAADPKDVAKFRKLKSMALAANDHEKDGEFFAGEMLAKRGTETTGFFGLLFNTIYWWLSDFGQSFVRPLLWLGVSFLSFAAACLYLIRDTLTWTDRLWFAADYSFRNMLPLFGTLYRFAPAPQNHVSWYQNTYDRLRDAGVDIDRLISLGIAQSLIGTVLLFLFLLALRNKFRLM